MVNDNIEMDELIFDDKTELDKKQKKERKPGNHGCDAGIEIPEQQKPQYERK
jgi:hypothetical protein